MGLVLLVGNANGWHGNATLLCLGFFGWFTNCLLNHPLSNLHILLSIEIPFSFRRLNELKSRVFMFMLFELLHFIF